MENGQRLCSWYRCNYIINFDYGMASQIMKKKKKKNLEVYIDGEYVGTIKRDKKNNILYPETKKTIEDEMTKMFEDDRPKSME